MKEGGAIKEPPVSQQVGSTHPTGMHSCFVSQFFLSVAGPEI